MPNLQRIIPLLVYDDIQSGQDFLVTAFGFEAGRIDRDGDGHVVHGEVSAADEVIWLHRATVEHGLGAHHARTRSQAVVSRSSSTTSTPTTSTRDPPGRGCNGRPSINPTVGENTRPETSKATGGGSQASSADRYFCVSRRTGTATMTAHLG
jgi:hypothetical protein